jgi:hypothetical protein
MKEEFNKDMESLRTKNQIEYQGSKTKYILNKKTEEFLDKRLKSCERNMKNSVTPSKE